MDKLLILLGLLLMAYNLALGFRLRRAAPGGVIGERSGQILLLVGFFALAYLVVLLLTWGQSPGLSQYLLAAVLFLGAVFVLLVLRLLEAVLASLE